MSRLICGKTFMLDNVEKGDFWKLTELNFDSFVGFLKTVHTCVYYMKWTGSANIRLTLTYINDKYISGNVQNCIEFVISKQRYNKIHLANLTTRCKIVNVKTKELMYVMDKFAVLFNTHRIYLEDAASTWQTQDYEIRIDMTLLTVMKDNMTFYEKYNYKVCEGLSTKRIDLQLHKRLLRDFRFDIFVEYLFDAHKRFVQKTLSKLRKQVKDFSHLHEFYIEAYEYYANEYAGDEYRKHIQLQALLLDTAYPWNAMVDVIQHQKLCMEKWFD